MRFTPEQQAVLKALQPSVFVSAGAGSGKTSLLVERYVRWALDEQIPMEQLPTLTFTRKAAAELKERIRAALVDRGRGDLAWSLESAPIGTIHSLCARLLRDHPVEAALDPEFGLLDEDASLLLRAATFEEVWSATVMDASPAEAAVLAAFRRDLTKHVVALYDRLRSRGHRHPRFSLLAPPDLDRARAALSYQLEDAHNRAVAVTTGTAGKNLQRLEECMAWLAGCEATLPALRRSKDFFPVMNCAAAVKPVYADVRQALSDFRPILAEHALLPLAAAVDRLLLAFHEAYERRKVELGLLDFADLELHAVSLLEAGVRPFPEQARLMVDEFQDTNALQCRLLDLLGQGGLLTVGDYYQSIYAFRGADPEIFLERRRIADASAGGGAVYPLAVTFRSRGPVVEGINQVFSHASLFGPEFARLKAHRTAEAPRESRERPRGELAPAVEVRFLESPAHRGDEPAIRSLEARGVAARVRSLVHDEGWAPRDIVVLLRSFTHVESFEEELEQAGVPAYVVGGRGYYAREEVTDLLALLRVLVNPGDDMALLTALRSPLAGASDDLLYLLRRHGKAHRAPHLWSVARGGTVADASAVDHVLLRLFADRVESLRRNLGRPGLPGLLEQCLETFDYDLVVLGSPGGKRRFANVRKLQLFAAAFEEVEGPNLRRFIDHIAGRTDLGAQEGSAAILAENEDVVRIMTIHKAKGLEFPVVVLPGLGKSGGQKGGSPFLVARDGRMGYALAGSFRKDHEEPFGLGPAAALAEEERRQDAEEEKRLVYVAVTRAEERIILSGVTSSSGSDDDPLTCIMQALEAAEGLDAVRAPLAVPSAEPTGEEESGRPSVPLSLSVPSAPEPPSFLAPMDGWAVSGQVSFSSLHLYAQCPRRYYLERVLRVELPDDPDGPADHPVPRGGHDEPDARALGTLVHEVLEVVDLRQPPECAALRDLVRGRLAASVDGAPEGATAQLLDEAIPLVLSFWASPVAAYPLLEGAEREVPFSFAHGEILVTGVFDLLVRGEDEWRIVDYKTNRLEGRSRQEVVADYRLQAEVYALAALLAGAPRVVVSFLLLRSPECTEDTRYGPEHQQQLSDSLDQALAGLRAASYPEASGRHCEACANHELCSLLVGEGQGPASRGTGDTVATGSGVV